jgi:hypothetical protein
VGWHCRHVVQWKVSDWVDGGISNHIKHAQTRPIYSSYPELKVIFIFTLFHLTFNISKPCVKKMYRCYSAFRPVKNSQENDIDLKGNCGGYRNEIDP